MADKLVCDGDDAGQILTKVNKMWPGSNWLALIQDNKGGWTSNKISEVEFHGANHVCGKNLVMFRIPGPGVWSPVYCDPTAQAAAQTLIDEAVAKGGSVVWIRDYILLSMLPCIISKHFFNFVF